MDGKVTPICIIAPTRELERQCRLVCEKYQMDICIYYATLERAAKLAEELLRQGAEIFISRRGSKKYLEKKFPGQVVGIDTELTDYIPAFEEAKKAKGKVAFFRYRKMSEDIRMICQVLGIDALYYTFRDTEECRQAVCQALEDGAVLGIGGGDSVLYAGELGLCHITVESSEESLLKAIETAQQLLELKYLEARKQHQLRIQLERYEMVFYHTRDAILAVDERGTVTIWNKEAEKVMRHIPKPYKGRRIEELLPEIPLGEILGDEEKELGRLVHLGGEIFSVNRVPIVVDGATAGSLMILQNVKTIQDREKKIRLKLHEKGLMARYRFEDIIGESPVMRENIELARKFARSRATILIQGETGTGKELFAQSIHNESKRSDGPFVAVNCGALPKNLLEAELFGYEEGAFTGAVRGGKAGLFEIAHKGTIFLDEIGEMPLETQVQLLRVLQEKEIRRIGSDRVIPVDIRVITATNRDLYQEVQEHRFREDLYYRLNVLNLVIPPLRERQNDMVKIGVDIYQGHAKTATPEGMEFVERLLKKLTSYSWPGNVRELHNLIERVRVLLSQGEPPELVEKYIYSYLHVAPGELAPEVHGQAPGEEAVDLVKWRRQEIVDALKENHLDVEAAARQLGISRSTMYRRLRQYQIELK